VKRPRRRRGVTKGAATLGAHHRISLCKHGADPLLVDAIVYSGYRQTWTA
jgi:hypothetical protein